MQLATGRNNALWEPSSRTPTPVNWQIRWVMDWLKAARRLNASLAFQQMSISVECWSPIKKIQVSTGLWVSASGGRTQHNVTGPRHLSKDVIRLGFVTLETEFEYVLKLNLFDLKFYLTNLKIRHYSPEIQKSSKFNIYDHHIIDISSKSNPIQIY